MKSFFSNADTLKNQNLGLAMIAASLLVIVFITAYLFNYQRNTQLSQIRSQGVGLVRLLGSMPMAQLAPVGGRQGPLQLIRQTHTQSNFAYAVLVNPAGNPLLQVATPGIIVPVDAPPQEPSAWLGERILNSQDGSTIMEFHGPVIEQGDLAAYLRVGYVRPAYGPAPAQLPFFATLALAVFLLTPMFYFLVRREIKPLTQVNRQMQAMLEAGHIGEAELHPSGELKDFMQRFSHFIEAAQQRIQSLESHQTDEDMSRKVLSYQKSRIESALQSLPDAVIVMDESGITTYANAKLHSLLGIDLEQVVGARPDQWCSDPGVLAYLSSCHNNSARTYRADAVEFSPDSAPEKRVSVSAYPLFSPRKASLMLGTLFVFRDVSDESAAKRARSEFVAHVAHELKTPLNVLHMYAETLQDDAGATRDLTIEAANVIYDEVGRLSNLISNLLSMTKIEMGTMSLERKRVKLHELVRDVFDNVTRSAHGMDLQFDLQVPPEISAVSLDKDLIRIAFNNLLTNAIKYNRPGGRVLVSAEENDEEILVRVRDSGIGIEAGDQALAHDRFKAAQAEYRKAVDLDPLHARAAQSLVQANREVTASAFRGNMSRGFAALENQDYDGARSAFLKAGKIYPGDAAVAKALAQVDNRESGNFVSRELEHAADLASREEWREAVSIYETLLAQDPSLTDARVKLIPARVRADLDERLGGYIEEPLRLSGEAEYRAAQVALQDAMGIPNPGPRLGGQIAELDTMLKIANSPVDVVFSSDNQTHVVLFRVAELGQFDQLSLKLRPGKYVVAGTRSGYRDVRVEFTVSGKSREQAIVVRCEEPIG